MRKLVAPREAHQAARVRVRVAMVRTYGSETSGGGDAYGARQYDGYGDARGDRSRGQPSPRGGHSWEVGMGAQGNGERRLRAQCGHMAGASWAELLTISARTLQHHETAHFRGLCSSHSCWPKWMSV